MVVGRRSRRRPAAAFITCGYCGASLQVKREGGAASTMVLAAVEQMDRRVRLIELQNRLEQLDREWRMREQALSVKDRDGNSSSPGTWHAVMAGASGVFGVVWTIMALNAGGPGLFALFGVVFVGVAIWQAVNIYQKSEIYAVERRQYEQARAALLAQLSVAQAPRRE